MVILSNYPLACCYLILFFTHLEVVGRGTQVGENYAYIFV